ncbi:MAG: tetratricopeptide repeat protein [Verrucomicrobia bacterium]|nr:tetratricopeptide repeat protein [Verrucomicrobiota bacterium]
MKIRLSGKDRKSSDVGGFDAGEPSHRHGPVPRRSLLVVTALCLLAVAIASFVIVRTILQPSPPIPVPANLVKLEPQLRAYIVEKVDWVRKSPRDMKRHATLGIVYAANSLWQEARMAFTNAARLNPQEPLAPMYVGVATLELGEIEAALKIFRHLAVQFPSFAPGFYRLGEALLRTGDPRGAEDSFRRLIHLAPNEWRGYAGLGDARLRQNDPAEASEWLRKALQLDPSSKIAHHLLGRACRELGRNDEAELELLLGQRAEVFPIPDAWSETASEHMKLIQDQLEVANQSSQAGNPGKAVEILLRALSYNPTNVTLLNNLAIAFNRSGQPQKAYPLLSKVLESHSRYLPACITMSFTSQMLGRNDEALAYADRAIALDANTAQAHLAKANALLAAERDAEAIAALQDAHRCDPQNAEILVELGDVYWRNLKQPGQAREHYRQAVQLNRAFVGAHARLAELAIERGDSVEAGAAIDMLRKLAPTEPGLSVLERRLNKLAKQ